MTPTAIRLKARLHDRRRWFYNQWFFKWHHIGGERPIEIDMFDGSAAHYAGIAFSGSVRDVYWDAAVRGVRQEITQQFAWVDQEVRNYNPDTVFRAIDECAGLLISFARSVRRIAVEKDRILRGNGVSFPTESDAGWWDGASDSDILAQADALKLSLPSLRNRDIHHDHTAVAPSWSWWERNKAWLEPLGWTIGLIGTVSGLVAFFV